MANDFYTAQQLANVGVKLAQEDAYLASLVARKIVDPLKGGGNSTTVDIKVPAALIARDRDLDDTTTDVVFDELKETTVAVGAAKSAISGVKLSQADLNLNLRSYAEQVLQPQTSAVADFLENAVAKKLAAETLNTDIPWDESAPEKTFTQLRKVLRKRGVPSNGIHCVVGVNVYAALLDAKVLTDVSQSGSTAALREGQVGRLRGLTVVESTRVDDDEINVFHRDAYSLVVKAPAAEPGVFSATALSNGFGLRVLRDFDITKRAHLSTVDTMYGIEKMPLYRITRDYSANTATVTEVTGGAAIRMSIADTEPTGV